MNRFQNWLRALPVISFLLPSVFFSGCGARQQFGQAQALENKGYYVEAGMKYDEVAQRYPKDAVAAEALYRAGNLYQKKLKLFSQAAHYYTLLIESYPDASPWAARAREGIMDSPDYFPLTQGTFWIEGDSETGGLNMRSAWDCTKISTGTYCIRRRVYAGQQMVSEFNRYYRKENLQLCEYERYPSDRYAALLNFPYYEGKSWKNSYGGHTILVTVAAKNVSVKVKAGEFPGCLKISEEDKDLPGSVKSNYYAPGVGWILTTTAASGGREHRNTELLSYKILPE
jgi:tetratricopeptide (TPR) repeat protein